MTCLKDEPYWVLMWQKPKRKSRNGTSQIKTHFDQQCKDWLTLATESEAHSQSKAQGALRSSVNKKSESEADSEARRNRSQKNEKSFFFFRFRFRFRRFRSSENRVSGIGTVSEIISQPKNSLPVPFKLRAKKMAALEEKVAEAVRQFLLLYDKSCRDFKDNSKKRLAWDDVAKQVGLQTGMDSISEYSFICSGSCCCMAAVFSGFSVWVLITVVLCLVPLQTSSSSYENKK